MATWVGPPRSYTPGRPRQIQYVVIHDTEGSEGPASAEAGAAYDKVRTDGTSCHMFVDSDSAAQEVRFVDQAHGARMHGNAIGVQIELCGRASQGSAGWHDANSLPMLHIAAREVAAICQLYDIPPRRLSVAQTRAAWYAPAGQRPKGIVGHVDITAAYPEDGGTHTDPGPTFPWDEFLAMVREAMGDDMFHFFVVSDAPAPKPAGRYNGVTYSLAPDGKAYAAARAEWPGVVEDQVTAAKLASGVLGGAAPWFGPPAEGTGALVPHTHMVALSGTVGGETGTALPKD